MCGRLGVGSVVDRHSAAAVIDSSQVLLQRTGRVDVNLNGLVVCWQPTLLTASICGYYRLLTL